MTIDAKLKRLVHACRAVNPQSFVVLTVAPEQVTLKLEGMREQPVSGISVDEAIAAGEGAIRAAIESQRETADRELETARQRSEAIYSILSPTQP